MQQLRMAGIVSLQMIDVFLSKKRVDYTFFFLNTGSPHHVQIVDDLEHYNVKEQELHKLDTVSGKARK
jgi:diaminopimelate epimerase